MFSFDDKCKMIIATSNADGMHRKMDKQEEIIQTKDKLGIGGSKLWDWVKAISTLSIVGVFSVKLFQTPIALTVDFPTLLSLLLGFFSVGLASLFYFKATDTSNAFYDNTNKFTKDIAQLLAKIESGFGERLKNIEDSNISFRDYVYSGEGRNESNRRVVDDIESKEGEIEKEKEEIESVKKEKDQVISEQEGIIQDLISRANIHDDEKNRILASLKENEKKLRAKDSELNSVFNELRRKEDQLEHIKNRDKSSYSILTNKEKKIMSNLIVYIEGFLPNFISSEAFFDLDQIKVMDLIDSYAVDLDGRYIEDMNYLGFMKGSKVTLKGYNFLSDVMSGRLSSPKKEGLSYL
ncbi:hypothetical protein OFY17_02625 [Marinomonas sp. C2222]|uniref:Chromosome partition protein Smc n=1 Tax=Marinomonas sargassi TaxID=2984494 RepID=A0ABT2YPF3_9GAMM|nr:hypothetical protein [Marinomonas sargassi]MCV2401771.1 hypothetical protein [Marinomonas sargassi]